MSVSRALSLLLLSPMVVAAAAGCVSDPVTGRSKGSVRQLSAEDERQLGRELAPDTEAQFDAIVPQPRANQVLGDLVAQIVARSPRRAELEFEFKILNSSVPNALALPGGRVYITRGLLEEIHTEAEFIAVMGHEFGHVDHRHAARLPWSTAVLMLPAIPFQALYQWIPLGRRLTGPTAAVIGAPAQLVNLGYSRSQELEADRRGLTFATELGYDPRDFKQVFALFERLEAEGQGGSEFALLRTHPKNKDRIHAIDAILAKEPDLDGRTFRETSPEFGAVLAGFRARAAAYALYDEAVLTLGDGNDEEARRKASALLDEALAAVPSEPLFWILRGEELMHEANEGAAAAAFGRAQELYRVGSPGDGHWKPPFYLGMFAIHDRDWRSGLPLLETALARFPGYGFTHFLLGQAHEQAGDRTGAVEAYKEAVRLCPEGEVRDLARARLEVLR